MIKKMGWKYTIKYYGILWYLALFLAILIGQKYIAELIKNFLFNGQINMHLENLYYCAIPTILIYIWAKITFISLRARHYKYLTGRTYGSDAGKFKRTYSELVDYFRYDNAEPHRLDVSKFKEILTKDWRKYKGILFGIYKENVSSAKGRLIKIPSNSEDNIAVYGPPGSGKTSGFVIINALNFRGSTLVVDIKGDIYNFVKRHGKRKIIRFCPDHPNALKISARFNPFAGINKMTYSDKKLFLQNMCTILLPDEGGNDGNYFATTARKMMQGIYYLLEEQYKKEKKRLTFPAFVHELLKGNIIDWIKTANESENSNAKEYLASFYGNNEKNLTGAYDVICRSLIHFSNPILDELLLGGKNTISINQLEKGHDIYLQIKQEHLNSYAPLFTLIIQNLSTAFTRRPDTSTGAKNRPILMLLDEFPQLTFSYEMINLNLSTLRSKSIICCLIQQGLAQIESKYGNANARSIIGNCNYQIILGSNDIESSEKFSRMFGMKKSLKSGNSLSTSKDKASTANAQECEERVFPPEYFGDLHEHGKEIIYFKGKYVECCKLNCYKD